MNAQNLISQMMMSKQPMEALLNLLSPQQKSIFNNINGQSEEKQAEEIAKMCNEKGITKDQLASMLEMMRGRR